MVPVYNQWLKGRRITTTHTKPNHVNNKASHICVCWILLDYSQDLYGWLLAPMKPKKHTERRKRGRRRAGLWVPVATLWCVVRAAGNTQGIDPGVCPAPSVLTRWVSLGHSSCSTRKSCGLVTGCSSDLLSSVARLHLRNEPICFPLLPPPHKATAVDIDIDTSPTPSLRPLKRHTIQAFLRRHRWP